MLTSLLPGLRDLRTPLAAGYLWLLEIWLLFGDRLPAQRPQDRTLAPLWTLGEFAGQTGILVASSFVAYLIGILVEVSPQRMWQYGGRPQWLTKLLWYVRRKGPLRMLRFPPLSSEAASDLAKFSSEELSVKADTPDAVDRLWRAVVNEEKQLATRLQAANTDLFGKYDRLMAESAFRLNLVTPLAVVTFTAIAFSTLPGWVKTLCGLAVVLYTTLLFRQAADRAIQSRDVIVQALVVGIVESRSLSRMAASQQGGEERSPAIIAARELWTGRTANLGDQR